MNIVELSNRVLKLEQVIVALSEKINILESNMNKYATAGQLKQSEATTKNLINQNSVMINDIQKQLTTITIPSDTRYYLSTTEIELFRNNYKTLIAMMSDAERLHQSLASYVAQFKIKV
jgi:exonuclease VII small subunit